jgi:transcription elongation GreA/GreB family factor
MKSEILDRCREDLKAKKLTISKEIEAVKESMSSDTKSSAGDKYETGREMMNQERDKLQSQLGVIDRQLESLNQIKASKQFEIIDFGAFVKTSVAQYFISISYGKISIHDTEVFMVSPVTPLAQLMMGKREGDKIIWNGKEIFIEEVY